MPKSWKDLVLEAKKEIKLLQPGDVKAKLEQEEDFLLVDVREKEEYDFGHLPKSFHVPRGILEINVERSVKELGKEIILYCAGGGRSAVAALALKQMGYENVGSMEGGFDGWKKAGFMVEKQGG